jgi:hypothetical protein
MNLQRIAIDDAGLPGQIVSKRNRYRPRDRTPPAQLLLQLTYRRQIEAGLCESPCDGAAMPFARISPVRLFNVSTSTI